MKSHSRALVRALNNHLGNPLNGAEVGVWRGDTSAALLQCFPRLHLYMVDLWDPEAALTMSEKDILAIGRAKLEALKLTDFAFDRRTVLVMDTAAAAKSVEDGSLDFAFIDASHLYEFVLRDTIAWHPKIRPGGMIAWHDYDGKGDRTCNWGVKRAVDEFAAGRGYEVHQVSCRGNMAWVAV